MSEYLTGVCEECGERRRLTKDGRVWHHMGHERDYPGAPFRKPCGGVGYLPARGSSRTEASEETKANG